MIRHILLIKFKDSVGHSDIGNVKILFESMVQKIDGVLSVEWGLNDSPEHMNKG
ncbi:Dabb family protein, partial [Paraglaciecola polaris]